MAYEGLRQIFGPIIQKKITKAGGLEHLPERPPFILAANHVGFLDAMVLSLLVQKHYRQSPYFITTPWAWKMFGKFLARHWLRMIPRQDNNKQATIDEAIRHLKNGEILGIFPEGERNPDQTQLLKGKTGAVRFAIAAGVPLVPVGIINTTGQHFGEAFRSLWKSDKYVELNIGPAIDLTGFTGKSIDRPLLEDATRKLMTAIGALCHKKYSF